MPAPIVNVVVDNVRGRILLDVTGVEADIHSVYVSRNTLGDSLVVRNGDPYETLGAPAFVLSDWEAAPNTAVSYRLVFVNTVASADNVKYTVDTVGVHQWLLPWPYNARLLHPTVPALSQNVIIAELGQLSEAAPTALHYVLGRRGPVVVAQVRHLATGTLKLVVLSEADYTALQTIMTQAAVLCLQTPADHLLGSAGQFWFTAAEMLQTRLGWEQATTRLRYYDLSVAQVERPPGDVVTSTATWGDVVDTYVDWQEVVDENATWQLLILGVEVPV